MRTISYKNHRFPPSIIARAVWLYFRFPLSLRLVEDVLLERGIVISYETIRRWGRKFGPAYTKQRGCKQPSRQDIWHLDELAISIAGRKHWLWRAVDQDGHVLDEIVQSQRDTNAGQAIAIERRILTCRFENESRRCRVSDQREARSVSSRSSQRSEISSSLHVTDAPLSPLTSIASAQWRIGKPSLASLPELSLLPESSTIVRQRDITVQNFLLPRAT